jgi:arylformamidase
MNTVTIKGSIYDLSNPIDISIPIHKGFGQVNAFWAPPARMTPVKEGDFIGATKLGGCVNFMNLQINPHGNGTHTECVGHIALEEYNVTECIIDVWHKAELISIYPALLENGDKAIQKHHFESLFENKQNVKALILRTLPNDDTKKSRTYSGNNPPYIEPEAMEFLVSKGIEHLLLDLPSVDREMDDAKLACHKIFWNYPSDNIRKHCSITELIYVDESIKDGFYGLHIQMPSILMDAVPSRPLMYREV